MCSDILQASGAQRQDFDLVDFAIELKKEINEWRKNVESQTHAVMRVGNDNTSKKISQQMEQQKVDEVEPLQKEITEKYRYFMKKVSQNSIAVLGDNPCEFCLIGMGSMARKEITPFSDFENIIVLEEGSKSEMSDRRMLEYFRWYAVIFQVILINLGETILPSVAIPSLNDYTSEEGDWFFDAFTKRGISFDGMMPHACKSPLGRQPTKNKPWEIELIKPVSLMARYLTQEENLKNGYHLADILQATCFVAGDEEVFQMFETAAENQMKDFQSDNKQIVINMIKDDMQKHSTKIGISSTLEKDSYNVKQFAYRSTTIFITGIAKVHNIKSGSCFDLVRKMQDYQLITEEFNHKLKYAVALACEFRLKAYFDQGYQCDFVDSPVEGTDEDISVNLINAVGKRSCYDYFEIACCQQYDAIATFNLDEEYMYFNPVTMCISISALLHLYDRVFAAQSYILNQPIWKDQPSIDDDISNVIDIDDDVYPLQSRHFSDEVEAQPKKLDVKLGTWYLEMQNFNTKLIQFYPSEESFLEPSLSIDHEKFTNTLWEIGKFLLKNEVYLEAQNCFKITHKMLQKYPDSTKPLKGIECMYMIGVCLTKSKKFNSAIKYLAEAKKLYQSKSGNQKTLECFEGDCCKEIGLCQQQLADQENALQNFEEALRIYDRSDSKKSVDVEFCLLNMGICLNEMKKFKKALDTFEELLQYYLKHSNVSQCFKARCLYYLGCCLQNLTRYDDANKRLLQAVETRRKDMAEEQGRSEVYCAKSHELIGMCFLAKNDYRQAINSFSESLNLWKKVYESYPNAKDSKEHLFDVAISHKRIGKCYLKYNFCEKALEHFEETLKIF